MADEVLKVDANNKPVIGLVTDDTSLNIRMGRIDNATKGLKVTVVGGSLGTVTSISQGTGILLTPSPITTTGSVALSAPLQPIATLGTPLQSIRVNAGATALEYYTPSSSGLTVGTTTITSGTTTRILYDNAGVLGEYTITGTGTVVAMATSPDITTSITTSSTSFTAFAGATTLLTIGGTGASASLFAPSTLDTSSSTTGAIRTSGGISAAKSANIGTTLTVGTGYQIGGNAASGKILKGNGTNFVASTETYAAPGTSGNVMTSDGTNWTSAAPAGGSGGKTFLDMFIDFGLAGGATGYLNTLSSSGSETEAQFIIPFNCTASSLYVNTFSAQPGTGTLVFTVRKNGVDQAITLTVTAGAAAGIFSDLAHTVSYSAGDTLSIKAVNGTGASANIGHVVLVLTSS